MQFFVLGAGGQARQVESLFHSIYDSLEISGYLTNEEITQHSHIHDIPIYKENYLEKLVLEDVTLINGMGRPNRKIPIERFVSLGFQFQTLIHPDSVFGRYTTIGQGSIIQSGTHLTTDINVGSYVVIDLSVTIGHDTIIKDYTTISPGVNISGNVKIGQGSWIGTGAVVIEGLVIGDNTIIGAGSVVTDDIGSNKIAYGVPAREVRSIKDASKALMRME